MKTLYRVKLENNIYLRKSDVYKVYRPYELLVGRAIPSLSIALKIIKYMGAYTDNIYLYRSGKNSYCVQVKEVFETLEDAQLRRKQFLKIVGGYRFE